MLPCGLNRTFFGLSLLLVLLWLVGCGSQDPPIETWVQLELNDSLALFDSVHIDLVNPDDTSKVYQILWAGRLPNPSSIPKQKVTVSNNLPFVVRIRAWDTDRALTWEMLIVDVLGNSRVVRSALPTLSPYLVELASLKTSVGDLQPSFLPTRKTYNLPIGFLIDSVLLRAAPADTRATVKMRRGLTDLGGDSVFVLTPTGNTDVTIDVTNKGNRSTSYRILIVRAATPNPRMRKLKPSLGQLNPDFNPEVKDYQLSLPNSANRLSLEEFEADSFATVVFNRDTLAAGTKPNSFPIQVGETLIPISVFAGSNHYDYSLNITVAKPMDTAVDTTTPPNTTPPHLLQLQFTNINLVPFFNDNVFNYTINVADTVDFLSFKNLKADSGQLIYLDSLKIEGQRLANLELKEGLNVFSINVVAVNGTDTTYTIRVTRQPKFVLPGLAFSSRLMVNTTAQGASIQAPVLGFPLLVKLRSDNFDFSTARKDGKDIRFAKANGTLLPHQVEAWDSAGSSADIWVRVDTVFANTVQRIGFLCWGNATTVPTAIPSDSVFRPSDGFAAVWHMDSTLVDATGNSQPTYPWNGPKHVNSGMVGKSLACVASSSTAVDLGKKPAVVNLVNQIQVEAWIKTGQSSVNASVIRHDNHFSALSLAATGEANTVVFPKYPDSVATTDSLKVLKTPWATSKLNDKQWHQFVAQYDVASGMSVYWDAKFIASDTTVRRPMNISSKSVMVCMTEAGQNPFDGFLDELRIQSNTRSSDWIKLNFETQKPDGGAVTLTR